VNICIQTFRRRSKFESASFDRITKQRTHRIWVNVSTFTYLVPGLRSSSVLQCFPKMVLAHRTRCARHSTTHSADELAVAMDSVVQAKHASFKRIQRTMDMAGPFAGRLMLAELLNDRLNGEGLVRSFLERDLEKLLKRAKLPPAVRNFAVRLPSGKKRVLDVAWPNVRRCLEADSWQYHSSPSLWGGTRIKDRELTVAGWSVIPVVVADTRDPSSLVAQLRTLFSNETAA
jgi:hypothetical protein